MNIRNLSNFNRWNFSLIIIISILVISTIMFSFLIFVPSETKILEDVFEEEVPVSYIRTSVSTKNIQLLNEKINSKIYSEEKLNLDIENQIKSHSDRIHFEDHNISLRVNYVNKPVWNIFNTSRKFVIYNVNDLLFQNLTGISFKPLSQNRTIALENSLRVFSLPFPFPDSSKLSNKVQLILPLNEQLKQSFEFNKSLDWEIISVYFFSDSFKRQILKLDNLNKNVDEIHKKIETVWKQNTLILESYNFYFKLKVSDIYYSKSIYQQLGDNLQLLYILIELIGLSGMNVVMKENFREYELKFVRGYSNQRLRISLIFLDSIVVLLINSIFSFTIINMLFYEIAKKKIIPLIVGWIIILFFYTLFLIYKTTNKFEQKIVKHVEISKPKIFEYYPFIITMSIILAIFSFSFNHHNFDEIKEYFILSMRVKYLVISLFFFLTGLFFFFIEKRFRKIKRHKHFLQGILTNKLVNSLKLIFLFTILIVTINSDLIISYTNDLGISEERYDSIRIDDNYSKKAFSYFQSKDLDIPGVFFHFTSLSFLTNISDSRISGAINVLLVNESVYNRFLIKNNLYNRYKINENRLLITEEIFGWFNKKQSLIIHDGVDEKIISEEAFVSIPSNPYFLGKYSIVTSYSNWDFFGLNLPPFKSQTDKDFPFNRGVDFMIFLDSVHSVERTNFDSRIISRELQIPSDKIKIINQQIPEYSNTFTSLILLNGFVLLIIYFLVVKIVFSNKEIQIAIKMYYLRFGSLKFLRHIIYNLNAIIAICLFLGFVFAFISSLSSPLVGFYIKLNPLIVYGKFNIKKNLIILLIYTIYQLSALNSIFFVYTKKAKVMY